MTLLSELQAFAKTLPRAGRVCWACQLPKDLLSTIHEARELGLSVKTMVGFLRSKGHEDATVPRLNNHFQRDHHEKGKK